MNTQNVHVVGNFGVVLQEKVNNFLLKVWVCVACTLKQMTMKALGSPSELFSSTLKQYFMFTMQPEA